jgi:transposase
MVAANARTAVTFSLSPGQAGDAPNGRALLSRLGPTNRPLHLLMDRAYEGNETRQLALDLGFIPVVPPLSTRVEPWEYDREMYQRRNEVERLIPSPQGLKASRAIAASSLASKNSTSCSSGSSISY